MRRFERAGGGAGLDAVLLDPLEVLPHFFFSTAQLGNVQVTGGPLTTLSGFDYFSLEITPTTPGGQVPGLRQRCF